MVQIRLLGLFFLLIMPAFACTTSDIGIGNVNTPAVVPTPQGDILTFNIPVFDASLEPGQTVQGADLTYVGTDNGAFMVKIGGLDATRRTGDSFSWRGVVAPSVVGNYNLRLTTTILSRLVAAGPISLSVFNPDPVLHPDFATATMNTRYHFKGVVSNYLVPNGHQIPGTALVYAGIIEPSTNNNLTQKMVELTGEVGAYPYHAIGDSVVWQGQLRPNVFVRQSLRIVQIETYGVRLIGTAELWIEE